jgi:hypothetical protein
MYEMTRRVAEVGAYDVVVTGGGMAGFGAACAAARRGARTLLIERFAQLGGMGSIGGVGNWCYCGPLEGQGRVFDDAWAAMKRLRSLGPEHGWPIKLTAPPLVRENNLFDHNTLPFVLQQLCEVSGVDLLFQTEVVDVIRSGEDVQAVVVHNRSLLQAVSARVVVDASGDGIAAQHAGAAVLDRDDPALLPSSLMIYLRDVGHPVEQELLDGDPFTTDTVPRHSLAEEPDGKLSVKCFVAGYDTGSGAGHSLAEQRSRAGVPALVRYLQDTRYPTHKLDYVAPALGTREGRRIAGDYVLTVDDIDRERRFPDAVAFGAFTIDTSNKAVDRMVPPYQIPLRSLMVAGVRNMLVAGRCFSADRLAMSSARVMATSCMMGQAAGITAALACRDGAPIRAVDPSRVRERLMADSPHAELMRRRLSLG